MVTMMVAAVAALAVGTYLLRLAGTVLHDRFSLPESTQRLFPVMAVVLLTALCVTDALTDSDGFAGVARPAGVAVALVLALRRAPFVAVVVVAAGMTALLRLLGAH
jgi:branched-subunit amino acid transport protein